MTVYGIIVAYYPNTDFIAALDSLAQQVARAIVVDNTPTPQSPDCIAIAASRHLNVEVLRNTHNLGIAQALNRGFASSIAAGAAWVVTLDQDSVLSRDCVARLRESADSITVADKLAIVAASPSIRPSANRLKSPRRRTVVITSGNLVRVSAYIAVNGFDERLFIDSVDYDFCLRLRCCGYEIWDLPNVAISHALGTKATVRFLGRTLHYTSYGAGRRYYQFRNRIYLYRRYWARFPIFVMRDMFMFTLDLFKTICLETDRQPMRAALVRGIRDGVLGRLGP